MIRRILRALRDRLVTKLTPKKDKPLTQTEIWLRKLMAEFMKQRALDPKTWKLDLKFNPLAFEEEINCPCHYGAQGCAIHHYGQYNRDLPDASEELAFLEWLEEKGIKLPKNDILRNDDKWRPVEAPKDGAVEVSCGRPSAISRRESRSTSSGIH